MRLDLPAREQKMIYGWPVSSVPGVPAERAWLQRAVQLAVDNVAAGGGPFAALVIRQGGIVGHGVNQVTREHDPTAHAEIVAIRQACRRTDDFRLPGCLLVASCEPCPMCLGAALWARLDRIVYAADRDDAAGGGFDDQAFHELFATPRPQWTLRVEQVEVAGPGRPFDAWRAAPGRAAY